ncbi:DJ-1/PfpI family protein [Streptomyces cacaoi]|uniref:DJ-1/PfpI family protein n=1 Tax=Streptomyces cacaoi TaxID=1898 RepID=UPI003748E077
MGKIKSILFLGFPNFGEQDLLAPWELLRSLAWTLGQQGEEITVTLGSFEGGTLTTHMGAQVVSETKVSPSDRYDLVYVPGGIGAGAASQNETVVDFVRAHHEEGRWVVGNCAGLSVLHRAGILGGSEVTAPATVARRLAQHGENVASPRRAWKIDTNRKIMTVGGAGTVHPSTIALVWHLFGESEARDLAATWDTLPLHGESLFALDGPELNDDEAVKAKLQDNWENTFLPE